ncbi:MAG: putative hydrolase [uncultured marine phage]|uniref:Putative hydrolase n=1 Tax=uncultured marine phage TaxID=707152 RepID=A0A8D9FRY1_9VIRU|nr:MAG: putative hydrolase [uncultured marine phage]
MKRALVVSVGGSKGAYAVGIVQYYYSIGRTYDIQIGSSTGALIATLVAAGSLEKLAEAYTNISHRDIFSVSPFKIKKSKNGIHKYSINTRAALYNMIIKKRASLGDSSALRYKTIPKFFSHEDYNKIIIENQDLNVCVSNLTLEKGEVKNITNFNYEEFCDWIWASTCAPPFMSIPEIDGYEYVDGGLMEMVPIEQAILRGADEIDVIILEREYPEIANIEKVRNILHFIIKLQSMMMNKIKKQNINLGALSHIATKDIKVNFHYTERRLTNNSLIFDRDIMRGWRKEGFEAAKNGKVKSFLLSGKTNTYKLLIDDDDDDLIK